MSNNYKDCDYSVFISYAHADDDYYAGWISQFRKILFQTLNGRLPRDCRPNNKIHLSKLDGPVAGTLTDELETNIKHSFTMLIVVGNNYVDSEWCLKELEYFKNFFGDQGFKERLTIIALNDEANQELSSSKRFQEFFPVQKNVIAEFYTGEKKDEPVAPKNECGSWTTKLTNKVFPISARIANSIKDNCNRDSSSVDVENDPPTDEMEQPVNGASTEHQLPEHSNSLRIGIGAVTPDLKAITEDFRQHIATAGFYTSSNGGTGQISVEQIGLYADEGDLAAALQQFDILVQPFSDSRPFLPGKASGGHLEISKDEWQRINDDKPFLFWNTGIIGQDKPATCGNKTFIEYLKSDYPILSVEDIVQKIEDVVCELPDRTPNANTAVIVVEKNPNETREWRKLRKRLHYLWQELCLRNSEFHELDILTGAFPLDDLKPSKYQDQVRDADGIIVLWGKKRPESVNAQTLMLDKLCMNADANFKPSFVAFLMPPQDQQNFVIAKNWDVHRFTNKDDELIELTEEKCNIERFLADVYDYKKENSQQNVMADNVKAPLWKATEEKTPTPA